jgi:uracil phosphoribosyltransferase
MSVSDLHPNLVISSSRKAHKLLFTKMRNASTSSEDFVKYSKRSMRLLAEDALAEFPATDVSITTPCGYVIFPDVFAFVETLVACAFVSFRFFWVTSHSLPCDFAVQ